MLENYYSSKLGRKFILASLMGCKCWQIGRLVWGLRIFYKIWIWCNLKLLLPLYLGHWQFLGWAGGLGGHSYVPLGNSRPNFILYCNRWLFHHGSDGAESSSCFPLVGLASNFAQFEFCWQEWKLHSQCKKNVAIPLPDMSCPPSGVSRIASRGSKSIPSLFPSYPYTFFPIPPLFLRSLPSSLLPRCLRTELPVGRDPGYYSLQKIYEV